METINSEKRTKANSNANIRLRNAGFLPATVYGKGMETMSLSVKRDELKKALTKEGKNAVFNLEIPNEKPVTAIIKEIQSSPLKREFLHVDFQQVSLTVKIHTEVAIRITGIESLDRNNLILTRQTDTITVKGFPQDIPDIIEADVSKLEAGQFMTIQDLNIPKEIIIEDEPDQVVASVSEAKMYEPEDDSNEIDEEKVDEPDLG